MAREEEGCKYLEQHKIPDLLHNLSALLLYHRPEKPREFLIQTLEKIKLARMTNDYPYLLDEANLNAMFDMLDTAGEGYITVPQYKGALQSIGLTTDDIVYSDEEKITSDVFKENVMKKFAAMWSAF
ncbi:EF-hand calcium-binding domain-containing protein 10 [Sphaerodactylus townsendi]|uniref:Uncharacterized protein n=1 Tax=Sphaerodactylus townsendi TaxID=933632 RepID=A0ACB8FQV4_9SAUR|nr:EF-hand calcium-binding domain-containing protein 10 [Sphaerodactylus townsendi]